MILHHLHTCKSICVYYVAIYKSHICTYGRRFSLLIHVTFNLCKITFILYFFLLWFSFIKQLFATDSIFLVLQSPAKIPNYSIIAYNCLHINLHTYIFICWRFRIACRCYAALSINCQLGLTVDLCINHVEFVLS